VETELFIADKQMYRHHEDNNCLSPKNRFLGEIFEIGTSGKWNSGVYYTADLHSKKWAIFIKNMAVLSGFPYSFTRVKRPGREVNHSHPFSTEVTNEWR
jgi:hypothetical protein